jgi:hypothetical protein
LEASRGSGAGVRHQRPARGGAGAGPARGLLRPGELIYVSTCPGAPRGSGADYGAARMALVIARADERDAERALGSVRAWLLARLELTPDHRGRAGPASHQGSRGGPGRPPRSPLGASRGSSARPGLRRAAVDLWLTPLRAPAARDFKRTLTSAG